jgi:hypothetical protein
VCNIEDEFLAWLLPIFQTKCIGISLFVVFTFYQSFGFLITWLLQMDIYMYKMCIFLVDASD